MLHYLRIAVTALSLTACVLLIVLWVRSYWYVEQVVCNFGGDVFLYAGSVPGVLGFGILDESAVDPWIIYKQPVQEWRAREGDGWLEHSWVGFYFRDASFMAPYWFWLLIPATFAAVSWLPWSNSFSLRTLLIATTLVAVVLGIAAMSI